MKFFLIFLGLLVPTALAGTIQWNRFWSFTDVSYSKITKTLKLILFYFYKIFNYLNELAIEYSDIAFYETYGFSFNNQEIKALKITSTGSGNQTIGTKPIVFLEGGISGR